MLRQIRALKEERNRLDRENEKLQSTLEANIEKLKELEKEARMLESTNTKLNNILLLA